MKEAKRQLSDSSIFKKVTVTEKDLVDLIYKSNKIFANLERKNIHAKEKNYFKFNCKKATIVGKFYLLHKICRSLSKVARHPAISNCGTAMEKISEFLDYQNPSIPPNGDLKVLQKQYSKFKNKVVPTENIIKMVDFARKNIFFEFDFNFITKYESRLLGLNLHCRMLEFSCFILKRSSHKHML